jgi:hypothetical protein
MAAYSEQTRAAAAAYVAAFDRAWQLGYTPSEDNVPHSDSAELEQLQVTMGAAKLSLWRYHAALETTYLTAQRILYGTHR